MTTISMPAKPGLTSYIHPISEPVGTDEVYVVKGHHADDHLVVDEVIPGPYTDDMHLHNGAWCDQLVVARGTTAPQVTEAAHGFAARLSEVVHGNRRAQFKDPMTGAVFAALPHRSGKVIAYFDRRTAAEALSRDGLYDVRTDSSSTMTARPLSLAQVYFPGEHQTVRVQADADGNYDLSKLGWGFALA